MSVLTNVELVFWNLDRGDPPTVERVRNELVAAQLNPERAGDIADSTAFRRAVDSIASKDLAVKCWTRKSDNVLCAQFDELLEEDGRLRRRFKALYSMPDDLPRHVEGEYLDVHAAYHQAKRQHTWADVSKIIQTILIEDGLGAYSPRRNGGVYFVPIKPEAPELLARIDQFSSAVNIRFLRYQVPDLGAQRDEIAEAIGTSLNADLNAHHEAIAAYHEDTKPGIVSNRREALTQTERLIIQLGSLLGTQQAALLERVVNLRVHLTEVDRLIDEAKHRAKIAGPSRRIAGIAHTLWEGAQSHAV